MTEPKKLTAEQLKELRWATENGGPWPKDVHDDSLLAHIAALEQERDAAIARAEAAEALVETADADHRETVNAWHVENMRAEAAESRVKVLEAELRWQPIKTAPKDGTVILMTDGVVVSAGHWKGPDPQWVEWRPNWIVAHFVHSSPVINENITHWMPLPALSTAKEPTS